MKKLILIIVSIVISYTLQAQSTSFQWVKSNEGYQGDANSYFIKTDSLNNIYTLGYFTGTADFNPSPSQAYWLSAATNSDSYYIQKLDSNGNLIWIRQIDFTLGWPRQLYVSPAGRAYIAGMFEDSVDIDPGTGGVHMLYSNGGSDAFILKLSANGNFIWAKSFGGPEDDVARDIAVDNKGNIYSHGYFRDTVDFDPGLGTCYYGSGFNLYNYPLKSAYILKLNKYGVFVWAKAFLNSEPGGGSEAIAIDLDSHSNIICTGVVQGTGTDFDPGIGQNSPPYNNANLYMVKLDSTGSFIWASFNTYINGWGDSYVKSIKTDRYNNIYATGIFGGYVDFDPGADTLLLSGSASGNFLPFIQKFDKNGKFLWAKSYGRGNHTAPTSLATDTFGNIYSTGYFQDSTDLDPSPDTLMFYAQGAGLSGYGTYFQKLNSSGNLLMAGIIHANNGLSNWSRGRDITIDNQGNILATGDFGGTVDFDISSGIHNKTSINNRAAAYILKLGQCKTLSTDSIIACDSIVWMDSVTYYQSNQSAYFTLPSSSGCDSVICLSLTIPNIDTTVSVSTTGVFSANQSLASYQWLDCNNGLAALTSDTLQTFTPTANGSYAVAINVSGCVDTSACIPISNVSIEEIEELSIKLYPNPNSGKFMLDLGNIEATEVRILNTIGQEIFITHNIKSHYFNIDLKPGIYFMEIRSENASKTIKFVVN